MEKTNQEPAAATNTETVGSVVARDFRAAEVFEKYGIDFCCGGNMPLAQACREKGIDLAALLRDLEQVAARPLERSQNYDAWELPFLADYIVNAHHSYLKENIPTIEAYANKIAQVHGPNHPEVVQIAGIFAKVAADMAQHLKSEEEQLFPAIRKLTELKKEGAAPDPEEIKRLKAVLAELGHEHDEVGAAVHEIRRLSKNYSVPGDACNTFTVTYQKLEEFEDDLHKHVHLENNILFPKAGKL
ncbi:iron-sulfur cluster repair di-iron protein [Geomonas sp. Red69]|uniref:Iron-sulfur cluster repair di-iron protein n=1 Tax=Geomonas diazotrophica TaxID=2843197 RepID=A0ABX8JFN5_9BACT|nr:MULTISPECIES: iron-sulfur cluster repair di-iron protein [Geomonas]MBU5637768.1 iron-sulfur cluster repair di-iron protein [Geomonas diazotrophica]QWV96302.1 iron-sulfur cluster repair di-iron protein [Geomonas nitrogeniifigens]QXE85369.1 iron-sulfur cluster repair di-iron protein [Geomonas nitrogeniifigens]